MVSRLLFALPVCGLVIASAAKPGRADPLVARLQYVVADDVAGCPSGEQVASAVTGLLHTDPWRADAALVVDVRLGRQQSGVAATISLLRPAGTTGQRELSLPVADCAELGRMVALAVAIALDPHAPGLTEPATRASAPDPPRPRRPPEQPSPALELAATPAAPPPPVTWSGRMGARAGVSAGLTPALSAAAGLAAGLRSGAGSLNLELTAVAPGSREVAGGRVRAWATAAGLLPCGHADRLTLCASVWLGVFRPSATELTDTRASWKLWSGVGGRAALTLLRLQRLELGLAVDGVWSARRYRLVDTRTGAEFWQMPRFNAAMAVAATAPL